MLEPTSDIPTMLAAARRRTAMMRAGLKIALGALGWMALAIATTAAAQTAVHIHDVLRTPGAYNNHDIAIFGHVREMTVAPHYTTFIICGAHCLNVLIWGHQRIS